MLGFKWQLDRLADHVLPPTYPARGSWKGPYQHSLCGLCPSPELPRWNLQKCWRNMIILLEGNQVHVEQWTVCRATRLVACCRTTVAFQTMHHAAACWEWAARYDQQCLHWLQPYRQTSKFNMIPWPVSGCCGLCVVPRSNQPWIWIWDDLVHPYFHCNLVFF